MYIISRFILQVSDETILLDTKSFTTTKGPKLNEKRFDHDCVLIEDSGISVIYVAGGWWNDGNGAAYPESIETLRLTNDNFAENKWTIETKIENSVDNPNKSLIQYDPKINVLNRNRLQLVKSNAKDHMFYLAGGREVTRTPKQIWALTRSKIWIPMESSLQIPRYGHQTLNVPSGSLKNC